MATRKNVDKIVVPTMTDAVENEEKNVDVQAQDVKPTEDGQPDADTDADVVETVSVQDILDYTPDAILAAQEEIKANHVTVTALRGKMPDAVVAQTMEALGITDDLDADLAAVRVNLGGVVAELMPKLQEEEGWARVDEYIELVTLTNVINDARAKLNLPSISIHIGGKHKGAAASVDATIHAKRTGGFMKPGKYTNLKYNDEIFVIEATKDDITVTMNGVEIYKGAQGAQTLSWILNHRIIPRSGGSGRCGFPAFLRKNNYKNVDAIMLSAAPGTPTEE